jgi:hypothetical protein
MIVHGIQLQVIWTDEDLVELRVHAANGSFAGTVDVYSWDEQIAKAAPSLAGFPTRSGDEREIEFGTGVPGHANGLARFRFRCTSATGRAFAEVTLKPRYAAQDIEETVTLAVPVEASAVDLFVRDLGTMALARDGSAALPSP